MLNNLRNWLNTDMKGFSLIEIIVGIGLMALISMTATLLLTSSLRSARKAAAIALVKNEGNWILNSMVGMTKYAASISTCNANQLSVLRLDGTTIDYTFSGTSIASNGANLNSNGVSVSSCAPVFTCSSSSSVTICFNLEKAGATDVTDRSSVSGIQFKKQVVLRNFGN